MWTPEDLRTFEEEVKEIYRKGTIRAPIHLSRGNEKQVIKIFKSISHLDWCFSTYRSHYHALLKGVPRDQVKEAILEGSSIHLEFPQHRFFTSAIVAGILPIALGVALGIKRRGDSNKVWCFVGDMAARTGSFHECKTYAEGFDLPITFIVECNGKSTNTPTSKVWEYPHDHITSGEIVYARDYWSNGGVLRYCYDQEGWPHIGIGEWVDFDSGESEPIKEHLNNVMA